MRFDYFKMYPFTTLLLICAFIFFTLIFIVGIYKFALIIVLSLIFGFIEYLIDRSQVLKKKIIGGILMSNYNEKIILMTRTSKSSITKKQVSTKYRKIKNKTSMILYHLMMKLSKKLQVLQLVKLKVYLI